MRLVTNKEWPNCDTLNCGFSITDDFGGSATHALPSSGGASNIKWPSGLSSRIILPVLIAILDVFIKKNQLLGSAGP